MKDGVYFISDLHLSWDKPEITARFIRFLEGKAKQATALYILGDLFDAWVGDDDYTPPNNQVRDYLRQLAESGTKVFLQVGNRDFLLGERFAKATGAQLLADKAIIDLYGTSTLLMHGDLLCTDDLPYQAFRLKSRTREWQDNVLGKPLWLRLVAARWYRLRSHFHKRNKTAEIMDVNQEAVILALSESNCRRLIHGHTHRPMVHTLEVAGQPAQRFVLADWKKDVGEALFWDSTGYRTESL